MIVRSVTKSDYQAITDIYNPFITDTTVTFETRELTVTEMAGRIQQLVAGGFPYLVAECDGRVVGFCYAHPWKSKAAYNGTLETTIYLSPEVRSKEIGTKLMCQLIAVCREREVHALIACITADNSGSIRFHERLGFKQVSHFKEVGFKNGEYLDVIDMELILD